MVRLSSLFAAGCVLLFATSGRAAVPSTPAPTVITDLALKAPFAASSAWRLIVSQGPRTVDPGLGETPGVISLCLRKSPEAPCAPDAPAMPPSPGEPSDGYWAARYLNRAEVVHPSGRRGPPLLVVQTATLGVVDQGVFTQIFAYHRPADRFVRVYARATGRNNNQEVRYIGSGPLAGAVISAEATSGAPFAYWITVNKLTGADAYRTVLRYRSATRYGDGNPLAVIDSEMPTILRRLGRLPPGAPPPTPPGCARPDLVRGELWCR